MLENFALSQMRRRRAMGDGMRIDFIVIQRHEFDRMIALSRKATSVRFPDDPQEREVGDAELR